MQSGAIVDLPHSNKWMRGEMAGPGREKAYSQGYRHLHDNPRARFHVRLVIHPLTALSNYKQLSKIVAKIFCNEADILLDEPDNWSVHSVGSVEGM